MATTMMKVYLETTLSAAVTVLVDASLDEDEARERAIEKALEVRPRICARCSVPHGAGYTLDLGDWDVAREQDGTEIDPEIES